MPEAHGQILRGCGIAPPATLLDHLDAPLLVLEEAGGIREAQKAAAVPPQRGADGPAAKQGVLCPGLDVLYEDHGRPGERRGPEAAPASCCENFLRGTLTGAGAARDLINAAAHASPGLVRGGAPPWLEDLDPLARQGYRGGPAAGGHPERAAAALARDLAEQGLFRAGTRRRHGGPPRGWWQVLHRPHRAPAAEPCPSPGAPCSPAAAMAGARARSPGPHAQKGQGRPLQPGRRQAGGDYVVHQSHGIGMYAGIQRLEVQGAAKDYLQRLHVFQARTRCMCR